MSIASVRPYARARLNALGYKEHNDGFDAENIGKTELERAYILEVLDPTNTEVHNDNMHIDTPLVVKLFKAPTRKPKELIDTAIQDKIDAVIAAFMAAENRLTQTGFKNVTFNSASIEPLNDSNDNGVMIKLTFTMLVIVSTRRGA